VSSNRIGGDAVASTSIYVDYIGTVEDGTNLATYTFTDATVGSGSIKSADRTIVICPVGLDTAGSPGEQPIGVTVGGVAATCWSGGGGNHENESDCSIWTFPDGSNETATIVVTYLDARIRCGVYIFNVGNIEHEAPHHVSFDREGDATGTATATSVQCAPSEAGLAIATCDADTTCTWTNATEVADSALEATTRSAATIDENDLTDTGTVTATFATGAIKTLATAIWREDGATPAYTAFGDQGIREIIYNGATGTGANSDPYVWDEVATGRVAGAGEQKYLVIHADVEEATATETLMAVTDVTVGGTQVQTMIKARTGSGVDASFGGLMLHSGTDTGTTIDISVLNPGAGTGTRAGLQTWSIYVDSGYSITTHATAAADSGAPKFELPIAVRSYSLACSAGSGTGTMSCKTMKLRNAIDMDSNDDMNAWDDGDDTGASFRVFAGTDTGSIQDGAGSPGGVRHLSFLGGGDNNNHWIAWNFY
jgi:hypothetical protein